ncbi:Glycosyltransferase involved in cell wall bisynthesis [Amphritea atlantica]|uniref:Glycosyltransferase involved in cell wall bisynthesis n=1 Tax=Amphritea atlantica TaxID=355243 RepID=A0A1H9LU42_9GAMM|nr:glycosyltransferase [Amphritea atlantica]SER14981.1 Glycosyltransferase involved in cell wall bisynthesis [Amphritea atlantica]
MKILLSAFACDPINGSEAYVGWNWLKMYSLSGNDIHVITRRYNKDMIESANYPDNVKFHYFDLYGCENKGHYWKVIKPYYVVWQFFVLFFAFFLHAKYKYIVAHHVTYNNIDVPGFLWLLPKVKFIWGPVGGGQVPPSELKVVYSKKWVKQVARKWMKFFAEYNPVVFFALKKSSLVMYANYETKSLLSSIQHASCMCLETAINPREMSRRDYSIKEKFEILWVGRIEERKALLIMLDIVKDIGSAIPIRLTIVGDGPLENEMKEYSSHMIENGTVVFMGRVPFLDMKEVFDRAGVFVFTSVQDTSGNVLLEAMEASLPVVAMNHQGAALILDRTCAELVDIGSYDSVVKGFSFSLVKLYGDDKLRMSIGMEGNRRLRENFTWEAKRKLLSVEYSKVDLDGIL